MYVYDSHDIDPSWHWFIPDEDPFCPTVSVWLMYSVCMFAVCIFIMYVCMYIFLCMYVYDSHNIDPSWLRFMPDEDPFCPTVSVYMPHRWAGRANLNANSFYNKYKHMYNITRSDIQKIWNAYIYIHIYMYTCIHAYMQGNNPFKTSATLKQKSEEAAERIKVKFLHVCICMYTYVLDLPIGRGCEAY